MSDIEWAEPPPRARNGPTGKYAGIEEALRRRPGQWARIAEGVAGSNGTHLRRRFGPEFELVNRKSKQGVDIYARYVGDAVTS